jgi:hypothetical protein
MDAQQQLLMMRLQQRMGKMSGAQGSGRTGSAAQQLPLVPVGGRCALRRGAAARLPADRAT